MVFYNQKWDGGILGDKDVTEKILESYNDVFSDIVNVLLFNGKAILQPNELEDQAPRASYKADGKIREIERDVAKRWKKANIRIACIGFENQTAPDPDMPLRVIGYDGAEYRAQLLADNSGNDRYPAVTMVLYFGHKKHWDQPLNLKERLNIPLEFDPYVNDYRINLFEIAYLSHEQVEMFQSDFRVVADYFVQKREKNDYTPEPRQLKHVQETLQLLSVMTNDHRFEEAYDMDGKGGIRNMCDVLDRIELKGRQEGILEGRQEGILEGRQEGILEGRQEGILEGRQEGKKEAAIGFYGIGITVAQIAKALNLPVETIKEWVK